MDWNNAYMCAVVSDKIYMDYDECYTDIKEFVQTKKSFLFLDDRGAQGCCFRHNKDTIVLAFRGTQPDKLNDLLADLKAWRETSDTKGKVHAGFKDEVDKIWPYVEKYLKSSIVKKTDKVIITGHSLGAAMATIVASRVKQLGKEVSLYNFGSPRVGNHDWAEQFDDIPTWRFVNNNDIVCKVPPYGLFTHIGELNYINYYGNIRKNTWWQRFKDQMRGRWRALQKFQLFDGAFDHAMGLYVKKVGKRLDSND